MEPDCNIPKKKKRSFPSREIFTFIILIRPDCGTKNPVSNPEATFAPKTK